MIVFKCNASLCLLHYQYVKKGWRAEMWSSACNALPRAQTAYEQKDGHGVVKREVEDLVEFYCGLSPSSSVMLN